MQFSWGFAVRTAQRLLQAEPDGTFALITFSSRVEQTLDFRQGWLAIVRDLDALRGPGRTPPYGRTALRDALLAATDLFKSPLPGDAIFLVSDGGENASKSKDSEFMGALRVSGVRVFAVVPTLDPSIGARTPGVDRVDWVRGLVTASGGAFVPFHIGTDVKPASGTKGWQLTKSGEEAIASATVGFANQMTHFYRLTVRLPQEVTKPSEWELNVVDSDGKRNKKWVVTYPNQFAPCSGQVG